MKRSNLSIVMYLCLVFLSGAAVGAVGWSLYNARSASAAMKGNPCTPDAVRHRYVDELRDRLKLTDAQVQKLNAILEDTHHRYKDLRRKWKPEVKAIQEEQAASIRAMLDDQQKVEYDKMRLEREKADHGPEKK